MKRIPLTQGKETLVDDQDYEYLIQWDWCANRKDSAFYTQGRIDGNTTTSIHQVLGKLLGFSSGVNVDHINRNGLDNRRENLRPASKMENARNRGPQVNNTSGFKGVTLYRYDDTWQAQIHVRGKNIYLGRFDDKVEAAKAYNEAAKKHFGEFAWLNPIPGED